MLISRYYAVVQVLDLVRRLRSFCFHFNCVLKMHYSFVRKREMLVNKMKKMLSLCGLNHQCVLALMLLFELHFVSANKIKIKITRKNIIFFLKKETNCNELLILLIIVIIPRFIIVICVLQGLHVKRSVASASLNLRVMIIQECLPILSM